jgi:hypothetical protein
LTALAVIFGWPRLLSFLKKKRGNISSAGDGTGTQVAENRKLNANSISVDECLTEIIAQLHELNKNVVNLSHVIDNNHLMLVKTQQDWAEEIATTLLKSLSSHESFANNLQSLLQRNLDELNDIGSNLNVRSIPESERYRSPIPVSAVSQSAVEIPVASYEHVSVSPTIPTLDPFDQFVVRHIEEINQASYKGIKSIQTLLQQISHRYPIELECPSDQIFILVNRDSKPQTTGKAFVLPGSYLGRPWVEWFDMPKGVYERVELTLEAATVAKDPNGDWSLIKSGGVRQQ